MDSKYGKLYQFHICIKDVYPRVWRRILVTASTSLAEFHYIIQIIMSWSDTYLHCFNIRGKKFGIYHDGGMVFEDDPEEMYLSDFDFYVNERFNYEYNFNDGWMLDIRVEKILAANKKKDYPRCIAGEQISPVEDCGGPAEYAEFIAEYNQYEVEEFNCVTINNWLAQYASGKIDWDDYVSSEVAA